MAWIKNIPAEIVAMILIVLGAFAKIAHEVQQGHPFVWQRAIAGMFVSIFSGPVFFYSSQALGFSEPWCVIAAGIGSFAGISAINLIQSVVYDKMGMPRDKRP